MDDRAVPGREIGIGNRESVAGGGRRLFRPSNSSIATRNRQRLSFDAVDLGRFRLDSLTEETVAAEQEVIFLVEESAESGYEARALGHSIFTEGETLEELKANVQDAVRCHFDEPERPRLVRLHFVRDEVLAV